MIRINGVDLPDTSNEQSINQIGTYHMAANANLYEIQRTNNFEFIVTGLENIRRAGFADDDSSSNAIIPDAQDVIRLSVVGAPIPHYSQTPIEVKRGNTTLKYAGVPTFDAGTITLNDYIGANTLEALQAWQNLSYNARTEKVGHASSYKKTCTLIEYSPDYQEVRRYNMYGCWISSIQEDEMNNERNEKHTIRATIQYDRGLIDTSGIV